jgi:hypothetical protein
VRFKEKDPVGALLDKQAKVGEHISAQKGGYSSKRPLLLAASRGKDTQNYVEDSII